MNDNQINYQSANKYSLYCNNVLYYAKKYDEIGTGRFLGLQDSENGVKTKGLPSFSKRLEEDKKRLKGITKVYFEKAYRMERKKEFIDLYFEINNVQNTKGLIDIVEKGLPYLKDFIETRTNALNPHYFG